MGNRRLGEFKKNLKSNAMGTLKREAERVGRSLGGLKTAANLATEINQIALDTGVGGSQAFADAAVKAKDYGKTASEMGKKGERLEATARSAAGGDAGAITSLALGGMSAMNRLK